LPYPFDEVVIFPKSHVLIINSSLMTSLIVVPLGIMLSLISASRRMLEFFVLMNKWFRYGINK
jgi:hypothetical protein